MPYSQIEKQAMLTKFCQLDLDKNGILTRNEIASCLRNSDLSEEKLEASENCFKIHMWAFIYCQALFKWAHYQMLEISFYECLYNMMNLNHQTSNSWID